MIAEEMMVLRDIFQSYFIFKFMKKGFSKVNVTHRALTNAQWASLASDCI